MKIYFDENFSPYLAQGFNEFHKGGYNEGVEVIHITKDFCKGCKDEDWIPKVAQKHGCIVTQDLHIRKIPIQWNLCKKYEVGIFFFRRPKKRGYSYWEWIYQVFKRWEHIKESAFSKEKPFGFEYDPNKRKPKEL
jgi:hypothetical protein